MDYNQIEEISGFKKIPLGHSKDLRGNKYGQLTPLYRTINHGNDNHPYWVCKCDCGNIVEYNSKNLLRSKNISCHTNTNSLDLVNKKFNSLLVLEKTNKLDGTSIIWKCKCDCGNICEVSSHHLMAGQQSCGCNNINNLLGQRFGKLTVIKQTPKRTGNGGIIWECKCDCGNICEVASGNLVAGHTRSCGCLNSKDLTNQRFGKLLALKMTTKRSNYGYTVWECKCDCGNICEKDSWSLISGHVKSCGCSSTTALNITGQRCGELIALYPTERRAVSGDILWACKCSCGTITYVTASKFNKQEVLSCGCLNMSKGAYKIMEILKNNLLSFKKEYTYTDCKDINLLPFDFFVEDKYLIEFDGEQHTNPVQHFGGYDAFLLRQKHDKIKNQYCIDNHIPLIRIPYTKYNTLCIEDLLLETTSFRVEGT